MYDPKNDPDITIVATLPLIVRLPAHESMDRGKSFSVTDTHHHVQRDVPIDALKQNLAELARGLNEALSAMPTDGPFSVQEVEVEVVINARGEVAILAAGGEDGEVRLRLRR